MDFKSQIVSDLYWATHSDELTIHPYNTSYIISPGLDWFKQLDEQPSYLANYLQWKKCVLLGHYFERLWSFYLSYNPYTDLVAENVQIFQEKRTLGELDFIYKCRGRNRYIHLEVACKYYLGIGSSENLLGNAHWVGPHCNDRLDIKYHKMIDSQSQMIHRYETRKKLADMGCSNITPEVALKGILFYPIHCQSGVLPSMANTEHHRGEWMTLEIAQVYFNQGSNALDRFSILEKPYWLSVKPYNESMTASDLMASLDMHFVDSSKPVMIAKFRKADNMMITKRYIVTSDDWPIKTNLTEHLF